MARPVAADAEATKARILAAGIHLVSLRGVDGTTVRDIAAEAKVSLATVLHYFGSKDGLYSAVVEAMDNELGTLRMALIGAVGPGQDAEQMLAGIVRMAWAFALEHRVAHRVILRAVLDHGGMPDERIERFVRPSLDDAEGMLVPLFGVTGLQARLALQTLVMLSARYAICSDNELCLITRAPTVVDARVAIGDHLVDVACSLLLRRSS
ncbi:MAG: TetR family transcriptional regulator [Deltaproteobacteria bacterium]|nr:TetR family transcriptional regulator [Deltaproteobacteria bacterium]